MKKSDFPGGAEALWEEVMETLTQEGEKLVGLLVTATAYGF